VIFEKNQIKDQGDQTKKKIEAVGQNIQKKAMAFNHDVVGRRILVVDDLYQSGSSMWRFAKYLKSKGAAEVCGLVCVKSLSDRDNQ
jgi:predicted amidophosphoribosyltransferase